MDSETAEVDPRAKESPFWRKHEGLSKQEKLALDGLVDMELLVEQRSSESIPEFKFDYLATDMYEAVTRPFGYPSRNYRQDNWEVTGGNIEYPDYPQIPGLMKDLGKELKEALQEVAADPQDIAKVIRAARLAHDMIYIHPFRDFNGRISRGLTHYVLGRFGYLLPDWQFQGRGAYLDAVAAGYQDRHQFEIFLAKSLGSSYDKVAASFEDIDDKGLSQRALQIKKTANDLRNFV